MPFPNEHACRVRNPGDFTRIRRDNSKSPNVLFGWTKDGDSAVQAFRYPKAQWTASAARRHCGRHGGSFEAASSSQEALQHSSLLAQSEPTWEIVDQKTLPQNATVEGGYPHHWVRENTGEMYLHRGGFVIAWQNAQEDQCEPAVEHLRTHMEELGLSESQLDTASTVYRLFSGILEGNVFRDIIVAEGLLQIGTSEDGQEGVSFSLKGLNHTLVPEEFENAVVEAVKPKLESLGFKIQNQEETQAVFNLVLTPTIRFPEPTGSYEEEETVEVVDVKVPDHEEFLESLLESMETPEGAVSCEATLFCEEGLEAEFIYQTHITGVLEERGRPAIYPTTPCCRKIRWKVKQGERDVVFGISLPPSRLEEPDSLLTALEHEPIPVAYIRPPQDPKWFDPDGYVKSGAPGASKNRGACYLTEDRGVMKFGKQELGYHEFSFSGTKLKGAWVLEYLPGLRGHEWVLFRVSE